MEMVKHYYYYEKIGDKYSGNIEVVAASNHRDAVEAVRKTYPNALGRDFKLVGGNNPLAEILIPMIDRIWILNEHRSEIPIEDVEERAVIGEAIDKWKQMINRRINYFIP